MRKQQIGWKRETDSERERGKEREREKKRTNQVSRSQIGSTRWLHYRPEFLTGAVGLLVQHWSLTFDRVSGSLILNMGCVNNGLGCS
jgi:hypothetical protein